MNKTDYEKEIEREYEKYTNECNYPTIALLGVTGCGKSSLINTVFGEEVAKVSNIKPETQEFEEFKGKDNGISVNLIDSKGYELEDNSDDFITKFQSKMTELKDDGKTVDIVWYCISITKSRIEDIDLKVIQGLRNINELKNKIVIVLTKCDEDSEDGTTAQKLKEVLKEQFSELKIFEVSSDKNLSLDLDKLLETSINCLDSEAKKNAFISSQIKNLDLKKKRAEEAINKYIIGAGFIGMIPIPFSDAPLLLAGQTKMFVEITAIYGVRNITNIGKSLISQTVLAQIGKSTATSILKFIPVVGNFIGGMVNGAVATSITYALGKAVSEICYRNCKNILEGKEGDFFEMFTNELPNLFEQFYKEKKEK